MCGVHKLTHTAYANQRMTLDRNFAKESSKRNTMIALRGQSTWRVFIIHVYSGRLAMPLSDVDVWEHATLLFCAGDDGESMCAQEERVG